MPVSPWEWTSVNSLSMIVSRATSCIAYSFLHEKFSLKKLPTKRKNEISATGRKLPEKSPTASKIPSRSSKLSFLEAIQSKRAFFTTGKIPITAAHTIIPSDKRPGSHFKYPAKMRMHIRKRANQSRTGSLKILCVMVACSGSWAWWWE